MLVVSSWINRKRDVEHACQSLREVGLTGTRGAQQEDVGLSNLNILVLLPETPGLRTNALVVVVHRDSERSLCLVLANHILVQKRGDFRRTGQLRIVLLLLRLGTSELLFDNLVAQLNALITDVHTATGDELTHLLLALSAKGALEQIGAILRHCHCVFLQPSFSGFLDL